MLSLHKCSTVSKIHLVISDLLHRKYTDLNFYDSNSITTLF